MRLLEQAVPKGRTLLIVAAPVEAHAVARGLGAAIDPAWWRAHQLRDDVDLLVTGVGKANSAAATMRAVHVEPYAACINLGICGALPDSGMSVGDLIVADRSVLADEGVLTDDSFDSIASLGFPPGLGEIDAPHESAMEIRAGGALLHCFRAAGEHTGAIATVSTCSGTDALARAIRLRTGAMGEAMEGAAIGLTLANLAVAGHHEAPVPFLEVRSVSNHTGSRADQAWDIAGALSRLSDLCALL